MPNPAEPIDYQSRLRSAVVALQTLQGRLDAIERAKTEPIAIIGLGCRFPGGANDPEAFWRLLRDGVDAIVEVPADRWDGEAFYDPDPEAPGKVATRWGGFLEHIDYFDPSFFGISPREAIQMDPQQRLLLEVVWEALEHAGRAPDRLAGSQTGVFIGVIANDYALQQLADPGCINAYSGTGNSYSVLAGRLSYQFDLQGPSVAVDTACSSSLVAVHLACQSLRSGECHLAVAGGVTLITSPLSLISSSKMRLFAADGRCKTFDARADGIVTGEGCGVVVLKRLSDALKDGDPIWALIRGSAVNQDGRSAGLAAPNGLSQQAVIRQALDNAGVAPAQLTYIEAHGTGTSLGDPIEVEALAEVIGQPARVDRRCTLSSVKTNIGHLGAAAGIAGLIKVVLALHHQEIPPHLHFMRLNPYISLENTPFIIPTEVHPWPAAGQPRYAGVSSFGWAGTNAHVILEEAPEHRSVSSAIERPRHLLSLSAKSGEALAKLVQEFESHLATHPSAALADVCYTAGVGRARFAHRLAVVAETGAQARHLLAAVAAGQQPAGALSGEIKGGGRTKVVFLFSGQGSQYVGMSRQLYDSQPTFRAALECCDQLLRPYLAQSLLSVLFPPPGVPSPLDETAYTQPALFALQYALATLWQSWGVEPAMVLGHSIGEYAAACVAGVFSLEDALKLVAERGRLMQALPQDGVMAAVFADEACVAAAIAPYAEAVSIAALNGPMETVISGARDAVQAIVADLQSAGIKTRRLTVSHAFHSPLMAPILGAFERTAAAVTFAAPKIALISNITGGLVGADVVAQPSYWRRHVRAAVRFAAGMQTSYEQGGELFVEIGPQPTLLGLGRRCLPEQAGVWLPSLRQGRDDWEQLLGSLGALYVHGVTVDWQGFDRDYSRRRLALPTYPFQRARYWLEPSNSHLPTLASALPLAAEAQGWEDWLYEVQWQPKAPAARSPLPQEEGAGTWLIFADRLGAGEALATLLAARGESAVVVVPGEDYEEITTGRWQINPAHAAEFERLLNEVLVPTRPQCRGVVHLWNLETVPADETTLAGLEAEVARSCGSILHLLQSLAWVRGAKLPRLWLVTRGAQTVGSAAALAVGQAPVWGLGRVVALEHPEVWGGLIDVDAGTPAEIAAQLLEEIAGGRDTDQVAFRGGLRYVPRLVRHDGQRVLAGQLAIRGEGTYLITGGMGALGLQVARWLVAQGARSLVLLGRRGASEFARDVVHALQQAGAQVMVMQGDVSQAEDVTRVLGNMAVSMPPLRGIIHAAGVLGDGILLRQTWSSFAEVLGPKMAGAWNLHRLTRDMALDFFVLFSSAAALLGAPGQGNYAAANAFLDALAHARRAQGLPAVSINWGPWADVGMAARLDQSDRRRWTSHGLGTIPPEQGVQILGRILRQHSTQVAVLPVDWATFLEQFSSAAVPPLLAELADAERRQKSGTPERQMSRSGPAGPERGLFEELLNAPTDERQPLVKDYLQRRIAKVLQSEGQEIEDERNLLELGMDSLMVVEVLDDCKRDLRLTLYPREVYERPSFGALASYLAEEFGHTHDAARAVPPPSIFASPALGLAGQSATTSVAQTPPRLQRNNAMLFVLSSPRSGSTLLRVMLAGHPALFCPPELHLLPFGSMAKRREILGLSYLEEGLQRAVMELMHHEAEASKALVDTWTAQDLSIAQIYAMLQDLARPRLLVDKSPAYGASLETLRRAEALFEDAKYIHLVRHPYAVIESFVRNRMAKILGAENVDPYRLAEQIWATTHDNVRHFFRELDPRRHHLVHYEDLVREPAVVLGEICEFLGVAFDEAVLQPYAGGRMTDGEYPQSASIGDPNFLHHDTIDPALGNVWRKTELPIQLGEQARRVAAELSYDLPYESRAHTVPAVSSSSGGWPMRERYMDVRGLRLCLCAWGPEEGPVVLCLHGILEHGAAWEEVAGPLADMGYHVIAPDQRGHGCSGHVGQGGSYHILDYLADVDAVARQLPPGPFTLVGHSMGAMIAAMFASVRSQQVGMLVLVETLVPADEDDAAAVDQLAVHLDYLKSPPQHPVLPDVAAAASRLRRTTPSMSEALALRMARRLTESCDGGVRWRWDALIRTRAGIGFNGMPLQASRCQEMLGRIQAPITLVYGDMSPRQRTERIALQQMLPPSTRQVILPGGHNLHFDAPNVLAAIIAEAAAQVPNRE